MTTMLPELQKRVEGVTVIGEAMRDAAPEIVEIFFEVHSAAPNASMAAQENANKVIQIRQALNLAGNKQVDLMAGAVTIWPILQPPGIPALFPQRPPLLAAAGIFGAPGLTSMQAGLPDGPLIGYHARSSLKLTVRDSAQIGEVLDAITRAGALPAGSIRFLPRNESELRRSLLDEAMQDAKGKANSLAAASGRTTGAAVSIAEDFGGYRMNFLPANPSQMTFSARVFVTYQLQ